MAEKNDSSFPLVPLLTLLVTSGGLFFFVPSLVSSRPDLPKDSEQRDETTEDRWGAIRARLWEDPITAAKSAKPTTVESLAGEIAQKQRQKQDVILLPVLVQDGPYVENVEARLRARHAVIQALARDKLFPVDDAKIAAIDFPVVEADALETEFGERDHWTSMFGPRTSWHPARVPFEWYERAFDDPARKPQAVLVLWLPSEMFRDRPLTRLAQVLSWCVPNQAAPPKIRVLGPPTSGELRNWLEEATDEKSIPAIAKKWLIGVTVLSSSAAATEDVLVPRPDPRRPTTAKGRLEAALPGLAFHRTIATDAKVSQELHNELRLRDINPMAADTQVALISEIDTYYARALRTSFVGFSTFGIIADIVTRPRYPRFVSWMEEFRWRNVHSFSYLRGLDGKLPGDKADEKAAERSPGAAAPRPKIESPDGRAQTDYLRRLSHRLRELNYEHRAIGGIRAVGVLGSDVYDKLEILAALRPVLPNALFFTNQIDARFLHPDEWDKTRNLVVAASSPLQPEKDGRPETDTPVFRDGNQTALYLATRLAVQDTIAPGDPPPPRLYEIGRNGPVTLSNDLSSTTFTHARQPTAESPIAVATWIARGIVDAVSWVVGTTHRLLSGGISNLVLRAVSGLLALVVLAALGWGLLRHHRPFLWASVAVFTMLLVPLLAFPTLASLALPRVTGALLATLLFALLCAWVWWTHHVPRDRMEDCNEPAPLDPDCDPKEVEPALRLNLPPLAQPFPAIVIVIGAATLLTLGFARTVPTEPLSLFDGVSHWPGVGLVILAGLLTIYFLFSTCWLTKRNEADIARRFGLPPAGGDRTPFFSWTAADSKHTGHIVPLWREYCARGQAHRRVIRAAVATTLYVLAMIFVGLLMHEYRPVDPFFRGGNIQTLVALRFAVVILGSFLTSLVVDAVLLHAGFLKILCACPTAWPASSFKKRGASTWITEDEKKDLANYWDLLLVGQRTEALNTMFYAPFVCLAAFLLSFIPYFDTIPFPPPLLAVLGLQCLAASIAAACLPAEACRYRNTLLRRMRSHRRRELAAKGSPGSAEASLISEVQDLHQGAFAGLWEQPWLRAWLLPSSGLGIWTLLQYLPR